MNSSDLETEALNNIQQTKFSKNSNGYHNEGFVFFFLI